MVGKIIINKDDKNQTSKKLKVKKKYRLSWFTLKIILNLIPLMEEFIK